MGRRHDKFDLLSGNEKPDWNMALFFLQRLDERLNERDVAFSQGDFITCHRVLRVIYSNIHHFLIQPGHEEEEELLENDFKKAKVFLKNLNNSTEIASTVNAYSSFEELLDDITIKLYDLLFEYNLIFPKKYKDDPARALDNFS